MPLDAQDPSDLSPPAAPAAPTVPSWAGPGAGRLSALLGSRLALPVLLGLALLLLLPLLGRAGLWDPQELRNLEAAREVADGRSELWRAERAGRPALPTLVVAAGLRLFGPSELGGRLPALAVGLLLLLSLYYASVLLFEEEAGRRRGALALLCALATPLLFLGARQATLHLPLLLGHTLAVAGLAVLAWPAGGGLAGRLGGALLAALGLAIGFFSAGATLGLCAPLCAVTFALLLAEAPAAGVLGPLLGAGAALAFTPVLRLILAGLANTQGGGLSANGRLTLFSAGLLLGLLVFLFSLRRGGAALLTLGAFLAVLCAGVLPPLPSTTGGFSLWLGGLLRLPANREVQVDSVLKPLGFQLFPVAALLPMALAALLPGQARPRREDFSRLVLLCWFGVSYTLSTYHNALISEQAFPAFGALVLAAALYLDGYLVGERARIGSLTGGCVAALLLILISHDIGQFPEQYGGGHFLEALRWPAPLALDMKLVRGRPLTQGQEITIALALLTTLLALAWGVALALPRPAGRRLALPAALLLSLLTTALAGHGLVPMISQHVSQRGLYSKYQALGGGELGVYSMPRTGTRFYEQNAVELSSINALFDFLGKGKGRVFVMVGATELAALDQFATQHKRPYYVVDDSNAQALLLVNQLRPGERDLNPLRRLIQEKEPQVPIPLKARFEGPGGEKLELLGYDVPAEVSRGQEFTMRLYFKVVTPLSTSYKVFLHFDGSGTRFNGDHVPLGGKYPTTYWVPGYYIVDEHRVVPNRMQQPVGNYQIFTGLWPGGEGTRFRVVDGQHDGEHRLRLGVIRVK